MSVPKTDALPLGDAPTCGVFSEGRSGAARGNYAEKPRRLCSGRRARARTGHGTGDVIILGAGAAGMIGAIEAGAARAAGAGDRPCQGAGREDPHLGRRAVQLHQPRHRARPVPVAEPALCAVGAETLHASGISSPGSTRPGSPGTKRRWGSCSATARPRRSSRCCCATWQRAGVTLWLGCALGDVRARWRAASRSTPRAGRSRRASVVVATGGKSIPKMGATGYGYQVAEGFGLPLVETRPGAGAADLCRTGTGAGCARWPGWRCTARVSLRAGGALTRRCCSPIAGCRGRRSCRSRSYWREGEAISVDLVPGRDVGGRAAARRRRRQGRAALRTVLARWSARAAGRGIWKRRRA